MYTYARLSAHTHAKSPARAKDPRAIITVNHAIARARTSLFATVALAIVTNRFHDFISPFHPK